MGVKLAVSPDGRWNAGLPELVEATAAAGFVGLGLPARQAGPDALRLYEDAGLRCHEILALVITDDTERSLAHAAVVAEAAALMHAPWINTVFRVAPTGEAAALVERCAAMFAEAGSGMAVEFSPVGAVPGLRDGIEVAQRAGSGARVLVDTWHFTVSGSPWEDLEALGADEISYIQFSDAPPVESDDLFAETMDRRVVPGQGSFDLDRFATTVREKGFEGYVSLEVFNRDLLDRPVDGFLREGHAAMTRYWS